MAMPFNPRCIILRWATVLASRRCGRIAGDIAGMCAVIAAMCGGIAGSSRRRWRNDSFVNDTIMLKQLNGIVVVLALASCVASAQGGHRAEQRMEQLLSRQPVPVQNAIRAQLAGGRLRSVDLDENDGETIYDVEMVRDGKTRSFSVGAEGELLDAELFMEELPAAIQGAIRTKVGSATLGEIDKSMDDGSYEVEVISAGKTRTFTLDANGKLTDEEVGLAELAESLQKAIQKETAGGTIDLVTRTFDTGDTLYDVDVSKSGKTRTLTFDTAGTLLSTEESATLAEVPALVKTQIQTLSNGGKVVGISKVTEDGAVSFDVDVRRQGKVESHAIAEDGALITAEELPK
jgi:uncharacterized membrane protein YkoI